MGKVIILTSETENADLIYFPDNQYPLDLKSSVLGFGVTFGKRMERASLAKLKASFYKDSVENICDITTVKPYTSQAGQDRTRPMEITLHLSSSYDLRRKYFYIETDQDKNLTHFFVRLEISEVKNRF